MLGAIIKRYYIENQEQTSRNNLKRFQELEDKLLKKYDQINKDHISEIDKSGTIFGKGYQIIEF